MIGRKFTKKSIMRTLKEIQTTYQTQGVKSLNDSELLSLLGINSGQCNLQQLLLKNNEELLKMGFRKTTAMKIRALSEVTYRHQLSTIPSFTQIRSSASAAALVSPLLKHLSHEECWVMYLNRANKVIAKEMLSSGGVCATVVDQKLILKRALELLACSLILVHNHPSGQLNPGEQDKSQTRVLKEAAALFDISLIDHIIIAGDGYFSFADDGLL